MSRREFPRRIRAEIVLRATSAEGLIVCEGCGLVLGKKPYQVDHTLPEALVMDKSRKLTAADGKLLGQECCHAPKTAEDIRRVRKADRQRDRDTGAIARKPWPKRVSQPTKPQNRASSPLTRPLPPRRIV
jgi:hypothetical protein